MFYAQSSSLTLAHAFAHIRARALAVALALVLTLDLILAVVLAIDLDFAEDLVQATEDVRACTRTLNSRIHVLFLVLIRALVMVPALVLTPVKDVTQAFAVVLDQTLTHVRAYIAEDM